MVERHRIEAHLPDENATRRLGSLVANALLPGDLVTLAGDLGSGKTTLAREIIRALAGDPETEVPSPTFTLMQTYETPVGVVVHADLYRLGDPSELAEIGWDDSGNPIVLVEWPERAGGELPTDRLAISLALANEGQGRTLVLEGLGTWAPRLKRFLEIAAFLDAAGWGEARRVHVQGDASTRRYERLTQPDGRTAILMDSPRRAPGPAIRDGKSYMRIARLAEEVAPFVAIAKALRSVGVSAPELYAYDTERGLVLLEDFGTELVFQDGVAVPERVTASIDLLVRLHGLDLPATVPLDDARTYTLPAYDLEPLLAEVELLLQWYAPHTGVTISEAARTSFLDLWRGALTPLFEDRATWVLRDYHSPNLHWLPQREGWHRVGVIDFQDALMGHPAYDVVSLLQDARRNVPEALEITLLSRYVGGRRMADVDFDATRFARAYATLGAHRATKILGIFVRLCVRDLKPAYLQHIPRLERYLKRNLAHPSLAELKAWYDANLVPSGNGTSSQ